MSGYRANLAYIHDAGYSAIDEKLVALLPRRGLVVDLGCGSGVWARRLVDAGYEVLGIDQSAAMIRLSRRRAPRARFRVVSVYDAALPPCAAVTALGEVFNYQFQRGSLARMFGRVHAALAPGGRFVFDAAGPGRATGRHYRLENDWACLVDSTERGVRLTRRITSFRRVGRAWQRDDEVHRLRLYPAATILALLRKVGFRARRLGTQRGLSTYLAIKAESSGRRAR